MAAMGSIARFELFKIADGNVRSLIKADKSFYSKRFENFRSWI